MLILIFNIIFYIILNYFNRIKVKAKGQLLYYSYSLFIKVLINTCYYISANIIIYKNKFYLLLLLIYYNLVINKGNYINIIYFFYNYTLFLLLEKIRTFLITKYIKEIALKYLTTLLLIFLNDVIKQLNFIAFMGNILFIIRVFSYLYFINLKDFYLLFNSLIFIIFSLLKVYLVGFLNNKQLLISNIAFIA